MDTGSYWITEVERHKANLVEQDKEIAELMAAATVDMNVIGRLNGAVQTLACMLAETRQDLDRLTREACFDSEMSREEDT